MRTAALLVTVLAGVRAPPAAALGRRHRQARPRRAGRCARPRGRRSPPAGSRSDARRLVEPDDGDQARALAELRADPAVAGPSRCCPRTAAPTAGFASSGGWRTPARRSTTSTAGIRARPTRTSTPPKRGTARSARGIAIARRRHRRGVPPTPTSRRRSWATPASAAAGRETNGVDDDGNGLVDDWRGWDFRDDDNLPDDANGHGTHVAGIARGGARRRRRGRASRRRATAAAPGARAERQRHSTDVAAALMYAARQGARVVNASLGDARTLQRGRARRDRRQPQHALRRRRRQQGRDAGGDDEIGYFPTYPCDYDHPNIALRRGLGPVRRRGRVFSNRRRRPSTCSRRASTSSRSASGSFCISRRAARRLRDAGRHVDGDAARGRRGGARASEHPNWSPTLGQARADGDGGGQAGLDGRAVTGGRLDAQDAVAWTPPPGDGRPGAAARAHRGARAGAEAAAPARPGRRQPQPSPRRQPTPQPDPRAGRPPRDQRAARGRPPARLPPLLRGAAALSFRASVAGRVRLTAYRRVGRALQARGRAHVAVRAGKQRIRLGRKLAGAQLRAGRWRVTLGTARVTFTRPLARQSPSRPQAAHGQRAEHRDHARERDEAGPGVREARLDPAHRRLARELEHVGDRVVRRRRSRASRAAAPPACRRWRGRRRGTRPAA